MLHKDVNVYILTFLDVRHLLRMRCVSKEWRCRVDDSIIIWKELYQRYWPDTTVQLNTIKPLIEFIVPHFKIIYLLRHLLSDPDRGLGLIINMAMPVACAGRGWESCVQNNNSIDLREITRQFIPEPFVVATNKYMQKVRYNRENRKTLRRIPFQEREQNEATLLALRPTLENVANEPDGANEEQSKSTAATADEEIDYRSVWVHYIYNALKKLGVQISHLLKENKQTNGRPFYTSDFQIDLKTMIVSNLYECLIKRWKQYDIYLHSKWNFDIIRGQLLNLTTKQQSRLQMEERIARKEEVRLSRMKLQETQKKKAKILPPRLSPRVESIVAKAHLGYSVDLDFVRDSLEFKVKQCDDMLANIVSIDHVHLLIYPSGGVVITGAKSVEEIDEKWKQLTDKLDVFYNCNNDINNNNNNNNNNV